MLPLSPGKYPTSILEPHLLLCSLHTDILRCGRSSYSRGFLATIGDGYGLVIHFWSYTVTNTILPIQRKTRCDPTLPRCLPCERSGSVCEYFDTTRNKKINRNYVVHLQQKVRQLEAELSQYTDDDTEYPESAEDMVRPGGLVKLHEADETPRYLGPSSGIAMTRLLMEQAKRYTDSQRISELIPDVRARRLDRLNRMQSIVNINASISGPSGMAGRKKSCFPMTSAHPAQALPTRQVVDKLIEIFNSRGRCPRRVLLMGFLFTGTNSL